jgi:hypothetical protein
VQLVRWVVWVKARAKNNWKTTIAWITREWKEKKRGVGGCWTLKVKENSNTRGCNSVRTWTWVCTVSCKQYNVKIGSEVLPLQVKQSRGSEPLNQVLPLPIPQHRIVFWEPSGYSSGGRHEKNWKENVREAASWIFPQHSITSVETCFRLSNFSLSSPDDWNEESKRRGVYYFSRKTFKLFKATPQMTHRTIHVGAYCLQVSPSFSLFLDPFLGSRLWD